ncbi:leucine rich adaptor protein 1 isoform 2-T2 [Menidia menidia]
MDEGSTSEIVPDLKDLEVKIGRKTPEGLLRWMREDASSLRGDAKVTNPHDVSKETDRKGLDEKIRKLKMEMAHLRSVDVKILQQLLAVHEGIEAVKWLMEERSTLTSHCSSLTSSQYSLGEGPDTSWRGSWSSLQDPTNDKLDNISIGSYLDTLADEMDEYCPSSSESVICSTTPLVSEAVAGSRAASRPGAAGPVAPGAGVQSGAVAGSGTLSGTNDNGPGDRNGNEVSGGSGNAVNGAAVGTGLRGSETGKTVCVSSPQSNSGGPKQDTPVWSKTSETNKGSPVFKNSTQAPSVKSNGVPQKPATQTGSPTRAGLGEKVETSPKLKAYKNGKIDLETCKMNGKMHLEYDAHWRWVQSQEDVTFL